MRFYGKKVNSGKGFTLVEVIVTLTIIAIMATVVTLSLNAYVKLEKFNKNESYAQSIYIAAQNALTHWKASGELESKAAVITEYESDANNIVFKMEENSVSGEQQYTEEKRYSRLYAVMKPAGEVTDDSLIVQLLGDYIYDRGILSGAISIELDPLDGIVYAVTYSDMAGKFTYSAASSTNEVSISDRSLDTRKALMFGFYGVETLSDIAPGSLGKLTISKVELINGETLYLRWTMSNKFDLIMGALTYTFKVYDSSDDSLLFTFTVNGGDIKSNENNVSQAQVTFNNAGADTRTYTFKTIGDRDDKDKTYMYLMLDAVDVSIPDKATTDTILAGAGDNVNVTSATLLKLGAGSIYVKMQASGDGYKSSVWKTTSSESALFGEYTVKGNEKKIEIKNARHLYNVRYSEEANTDASLIYTYVQTASAVWGGTDGILAHGRVFANGNLLSLGNSTVKSTDTVFPCINELKSNSSYTVKNPSGKAEKYDIRYLILKDVGNDSNDNNEIYKRDTDTLNDNIDYHVGLFETVYGSVNGITMTQVYAEGIANVGAVCGINHGTLSDISVLSGTVTGIMNVGGIVGKDSVAAPDADDGFSYEKLSSNTEVTGFQNVGGIIGLSTGTVNIKNCSFTGKLTVDLTDEDKDGDGKRDEIYGERTLATVYGDDTNNFGGIIGYNTGAAIIGCGSSMHITPADPFVPENLGSAVGGIVGYNSISGNVTACSTGSESEPGYVIGKDYVGGIIGYQDTSIAITTPVTIEADGGKNRSYVIGDEYVGGIVGFIHLQEGMTSESTPIILSKWLNEGIVTAAYQYGGGIVGYNSAAVITDCVSKVNTRDKTGQQVMDYILDFGSTGNYIGGLVGYNSGVVKATSAMSVSSIVCGQDYVGGCIGYNTGDAQFENISLSGGFIQGKRFVGGVIGFNVGDKVYKSNVLLSSSPNSVKGGLFVGGVIGASVISIKKDISGDPEKNIVKTSFKVDNFLGSIEGGAAFTGGAIGYLKLLRFDKDYTDYIEGLLSAIDGITDAETVYTKVEELNNTVTGGEYVYKPEGGFVIEPVNNQTSNYTRMAEITGGICVSGLIGYTDDQMMLTGDTITLKIDNYVNYTPITAKEAITLDSVEYSYAGAIIGRSGKKTSIISCTNSGSASVSTVGDYTGGLTEVNFGTIEKCVAASIGSARINNIGGLTGINSGSIIDCQLSGTVTGGTCVGGFAALNDGDITVKTVSDTILTGSVNGMTEVGGIAGINNGSISNITAKSFSVSASASNAGGITGINNGTVTGCTQDSSVIITAKSGVGGFIGLQQKGNSKKDEPAVSGCTSAASVTGEAFTGGIVGNITTAEELTVSDCTVTGKITAKAGNCGGIVCAVSNEHTTIEKCDFSGTINSTKGYCGGIVSVNSGNVSNCTVGKNGKADITGQDRLGGITADNSGTISSASVISASIYDIRGITVSTFLGGIAGNNSAAASITDSHVGTGVNVTTYIEGSSVGGAVGRNLGTVSGNSSSVSEVGTVLSPYGTVNCNLGGIVGVNEGTVSYFRFTGTITGNGGNAYGYGGICGINGNSGNVAAVLSNCITSGSITVKGEGADYVNVGGTAGINENGASIKECVFSSADGTGVLSLTADFGYIGGCVGHNYGSIIDCNNYGDNNDTYLDLTDDTPDNTTVTVVAKYGGDIGGIVGRNERYGDVDRCSTGAKWTVSAEKHQTDNTIAGIIGYSISDSELTELNNYAHVVKTVASSNVVGGIIGRSENNTSSEWKLLNCNNYGNIEGNERAAGIIAQIKYRGGYIEKCYNFGDIKTKNLISGGIVGFCYTINSNEIITINSCENRGTVSGSNTVAGILANINTNGGSNVRIQVADCINIGSIRCQKDKTAGIIADNSGGTVILTRCRNYGDTDSILTFCGLSAPSSSIINCFNVADVSAYPLEKKFDAAKYFSSYYFTKSDDSPLYSTPYIQAISIRNNRSIDTKIEYMYDYAFAQQVGFVANGVLDGISDSGTDSSVYLDIGLSTAVDFNDSANKLHICWYQPNANTARDYRFLLMYRSKSDSTLRYVNDSEDNPAVFTGTGCMPVSGGIAENAAYSNSYDLSLYAANNSGLDEVTALTVRIVYVKNKNSTVCSSVGAIYELWFDKVSSIKPVSSGEKQDADYKLNVTKQDDGSYNAVSMDGYVSISGLPFDPNDTDNMGKRVYTPLESYTNIDPLIRLYYKTSLLAATPEIPTGLTFTPSNAGYSVTWNIDRSVSEYKLSVTCAETGYSYSQTLSSAAVVLWIPPEELYGKTVSAVLTAVGTEGSSSTEPLDVMVRIVLPEPEVRAELTDNANDNTFVFRLLNISDYQKLNLQPGSFTVKAGFNNKYIEIDLKTGYSSPFVASTNVDNGVSANFSAYAESKNTNAYISSSTVVYQTQVVSTALLKKASLFTSTGLGFTGVSADTLAYKLKLFPSKGEVFARSELLVHDSVFGVISAASGLTRVTSLGKEVTVTLSLPKDIISSLTDDWVQIRAYTQHSQNAVVCFGYDVVSDDNSSSVVTGLTAEDLVRQYPDKFNNISYNEEKLSNAEPKPGYIVTYYGSRTNGGVTELLYTLHYNAFLEQRTDYDIQVNILSATALPASMPKPVLADTIAEAEDGSDGLLFKWDEGKNYTNATYAVTVTGLNTLTGEKSVIFSESSYTGNTLLLNLPSWSWAKVTLSVERLGSEDKSGYTDNRSSSAEKEYDVKLALTQITAPTVRLHEGNKDNVEYDVVWQLLTAGIVGDREYNAIAGYTVYAVSEADPEISITPVTVALEDLKPEDIAKNAGSVVINLEDENGNPIFTGGENILIYVVANAKKNESGELLTEYADSDEGVPYVLLMPSRLLTPDTSGLSLNKVFDLANPVSVTEFKNDGFVLTMTSEDKTDGKYMIEAMLYSLPRTESDTKLIKSWSAVMTGSVQTSTFDINELQPDWAGYYLYVRIRTIADSSVSSNWSKYKEFRLAALRPDSVTVTNSTVQVDNINVSNMYPAEGSSILSDTHSFAHDAFSFRTVNYASSYTFTVTGLNANMPETVVTVELGKEQKTVTDVKVNGVSVVTTRKDNNTYKLFDRYVTIERDGRVYSFRSDCTLKAEIGSDGLMLFTVILPDVHDDITTDADGFTYWLRFTDLVHVVAHPDPVLKGRSVDSEPSVYNSQAIYINIVEKPSVIYTEKLSAVTGVSVNKADIMQAADGSWYIRVNWKNYTPIHAADSIAAVPDTPASYTVTVADQYTYPTAEPVTFEVSSSGSIFRLPAGSFRNLQKVYIYVTANPEGSSPYAKSPKGPAAIVELPEMEKLSAVTGVTVNAESDIMRNADDSWNIRVSWSPYIQTHADGGVAGVPDVPQSYTVTVADSYQNPVSIQKFTDKTSGGIMTLPKDSFAAGQQVYIYVTAEPVPGSPYQASPLGSVAAVVLPEKEKLAAVTGVTASQTDVVPNADGTWNIKVTWSPYIPVHADGGVAGVTDAAESYTVTVAAGEQDTAEKLEFTGVVSGGTVILPSGVFSAQQPVYIYVTANPVPGSPYLPSPKGTAVSVVLPLYVSPEDSGEEGETP